MANTIVKFQRGITQEQSNSPEFLELIEQSTEYKYEQSKKPTSKVFGYISGSIEFDFVDHYDSISDEEKRKLVQDSTKILIQSEERNKAMQKLGLTVVTSTEKLKLAQIENAKKEFSGEMLEKVLALLQK